ncbi:unnamed protein product [Pleuronectes platessa]|uniref:Uncharacterized protein n=1 Tax=Pleuronectes platessa TaxID=8262 RepID=A0A9N7VT67_PLEPL|nr:unnamed protein product [Pleuronectes platessa]
MSGTEMERAVRRRFSAGHEDPEDSQRDDSLPSPDKSHADTNHTELSYSRSARGPEAKSTSVRLPLIIPEADRSRTAESEETVVCLESGLVRGERFNQAARAEIIPRERSAGDVCGRLFPRARVPVPGSTSLEGKKCRGRPAGALW